ECPTVEAAVARGQYDRTHYSESRKPYFAKSVSNFDEPQTIEPRPLTMIKHARFYFDRCRGFKFFIFCLSCAASIIFALIHMFCSVQWIMNGALNPLLSHQIIIALFTLIISIQAIFRFVSATDDLHFATIQLMTTLFLACLFIMFTLVGTIEQMIPNTYSGPLAQPMPKSSFSKDTSSSTPWIKQAEGPLDQASTEPGTFLIVCGFLSLFFPAQNVVVLRYVLRASEMRRPAFHDPTMRMEDSHESEALDQNELLF
ncbi:hypothetical protein FBUS_09465, partial [Fasciolopsis buskii]